MSKPSAPAPHAREPTRVEYGPVGETNSAREEGGGPGTIMKMRSPTKQMEALEK